MGEVVVSTEQQPAGTFQGVPVASIVEHLRTNETNVAKIIIAIEKMGAQGVPYSQLGVLFEDFCFTYKERHDATLEQHAHLLSLYGSDRSISDSVFARNAARCTQSIMARRGNQVDRQGVYVRYPFDTLTEAAIARGTSEKLDPFWGELLLLDLIGIGQKLVKLGEEGQDAFIRMAPKIFLDRLKKEKDRYFPERDAYYSGVTALFGAVPYRDELKAPWEVLANHSLPAAAAYSQVPNSLLAASVNKRLSDLHGEQKKSDSSWESKYGHDYSLQTAFSWETLRASLLILSKQEKGTKPPPHWGAVFGTNSGNEYAMLTEHIAVAGVPEKPAQYIADLISTFPEHPSLVREQILGTLRTMGGLRHSEEVEKAARRDALYETCLTWLKGQKWEKGDERIWKRLIDQTPPSQKIDQATEKALFDIDGVSAQYIYDVLTPTLGEFSSWDRLKVFLQYVAKFGSPELSEEWNKGGFDGMFIHGAYKVRGELYTGIAAMEEIGQPSQYLKALAGDDRISAVTLYGQARAVCQIKNKDTILDSDHKNVALEIRAMMEKHGVTGNLGQLARSYIGFEAKKGLKEAADAFRFCVGLKGVNDPLISDLIQSFYLIRSGQEDKSSVLIHAAADVLSKRPWTRDLIPAWHLVQTGSYYDDRNKRSLKSNPLDYDAGRYEQTALAAVYHSDRKEHGEVLAALQKEGALPELLSGLAIEGGAERLSPKILDTIISNSIANAESLKQNEYPNASISWSSGRTPSFNFHVGQHSAKATMAVIGGGPAGILTARFREELGFEHTTIYSKDGKLGGIWLYKNVVRGGHNTFASANAFGTVLLGQGERPGEDLQNFLSGLVDGLHTTGVRAATVDDIEYDRRTGKYIIHSHGSDGGSLSYDSVCIATGLDMPRSLDDGPIKTDAHKNSVKMIRWLGPISEKDYKLFHNTSPLLIGLGNSTLEMIIEFRKMSAAGIRVKPVILTHYSNKALQNPSYFSGKEDNLIRPLYRTRGDLTRLSGDISEDSSLFYDAYKDGWIKGDIKSWNVTEEKGSSYSVTVTRTDGSSFTIETVPRIWALIGYQNDPDVMKRFGCKVIGPHGEIEFDRFTGRVGTTFEGSPGRMYGAGFAVASRDDPNHEVIPGMLRTIPATVTLGEVIASRAALPRSFWKEDRLRKIPDINSVIANLFS